MGEDIAPVALGPGAELNWIAEQDAAGLGFNPWDPVEWERRGWRRGWGDAAVMSPYFEMLTRGERDSGWIEYLILCPTFLRRPLRIRVEVSDGQLTQMASY
jgi:hypothetical protein